MSNPDSEAGTGADTSQLRSAMFASLVLQNANMALILLGKAPHPQTGQTIQDLDHARYFIDQLEMLEVKTKGNLDKQEAALLNQSLTNLRLAFVEAVEHPLAAPQSGAPAGPPTDEQETPVTEPSPADKPGQPPTAQPTVESHKKFSKKY
ncbi:MAG: DUF1844 domain-containing protein [Verrucomicrobiota bacterium]|jgi:hypothetical protein